MWPQCRGPVGPAAVTIGLIKRVFCDELLMKYEYVMLHHSKFRLEHSTIQKKKDQRCLRCQIKENIVYENRRKNEVRQSCVCSKGLKHNTTLENSLTKIVFTFEPRESRRKIKHSFPRKIGISIFFFSKEIFF